MNKKLDNLFEQARNSIQSEMPLEEVQELIYGQASPFFWTNQKIWIMSTSIISIIIIGTICLWNNQQFPQTIVNKKTPIPAPTTIQLNNNHQEITAPIGQKAMEIIPDNIPLPVLSNNKTTPIQPPPLLVDHTPFVRNNQPTKLDSLGPKKTFTEYKLEIKKENSEQEIKKLKSELANYGIYLKINKLSYDNKNKIKRFKGKFKTDSLFCGSTMNDYEFDISGSFKSMEFIFRVADNKNLKYLKIQSDNFEETIECYDDEVLSSTQEAKKISREMHEVMLRAQHEIAEAQREMARVKEEIISVKRKELFKSLDDEETTTYEGGVIDLDWDQIESDIEDAMDNVDINLEGIREDVLESLEEAEVLILDNKNFKEDMYRLKRDLAKMRTDIKYQVEAQIRANRAHNEEFRVAIEAQVKARENANKKRNKALLERYKMNHSYREERSAEQLENEAKELEKAAKKLRKEANKKAKAAKKKRKQNNE